MPQSLANILVHLVFSTKNRARFLSSEIRDDLHGYISGIIENLGGKLLKAGLVEDHIHLLLAHPRTCSAADPVKEIKVSTNAWLKDKGFQLGRVRMAGRLWDVFNQPFAQRCLDGAHRKSGRASQDCYLSG